MIAPRAAVLGGVAVAAAVVVGAGAGVLTRSAGTTGATARAEARWEADSCAAAQDWRPQRGRSAVEVQQTLRSAPDGLAYKAVALRHLDEVEARVAPLLARYEAPALPERVRRQEAALREARDELAEARGRINAADVSDPRALAFAVGEALEHVSESELVLADLACPEAS